MSFDPKTGGPVANSAPRSILAELAAKDPNWSVEVERIRKEAFALTPTQQRLLVSDIMQNLASRP
jgi:hypothetical protein